jgi:predicted nucleic acid-binding protein
VSGGPSESRVTNGPAQAAISTAEAPTAIAKPPYVIDTSVAVKWYIPETFSLEAKRYLDRGLDRHAPDYLPVEAASVVLKRVRTQDPNLRLTRDEGQMVLAAVQSAPIQLHDSRPQINPAFALAEEIGASLYDSLFLALALWIGGELVTADDKLFRKIQASPYAAHVRWVEIAP